MQPWHEAPVDKLLNMSMEADTELQCIYSPSHTASPSRSRQAGRGQMQKWRRVRHG